jgi:hypothetical protein
MLLSEVADDCGEGVGEEFAVTDSQLPSDCLILLDLLEGLPDQMSTTRLHPKPDAALV